MGATGSTGQQRAVVRLPSVNVTGRKSNFGAVIGQGPGGVKAHSSHYATASGDVKTYNHEVELHDPATRGDSSGTVPTSAGSATAGFEVYTGAKWQCVEYARRYLLERHQITFPSVWMAFQILSLSHFEQLDWSKKRDGHPTWEKVPICKTEVGQQMDRQRGAKEGGGAHSDHSHGDCERKEDSEWHPPAWHFPVEGSIMMWKPWKNYFLTGHVAVVTHCRVLDLSTEDAERREGDPMKLHPAPSADLSRLGCSDASELHHSIAATHFPLRISTQMAQKYEKGEARINQVALVGVAEQNVSDATWPTNEDGTERNYARELLLVVVEEASASNGQQGNQTTVKESVWIFDQEYPKGSVSGWVTPEPVLKAISANPCSTPRSSKL